MEINLLVLNLGNTRLAMGSFSAGELTEVVRVPHGKRGDWESSIAAIWAGLAHLESAAVIAASVNPALEEPLSQTVEKVTGKRLLWVGRDIELPINVLSPEPKKTGVDRVLNVATAYEQIGKACVVVDAGTAITIDCCNDNGDFLGGAIAPGVAMMLDALHEKTALLPRVELETPKGPFGKTTADAIRQGVFHGIRGMVRELVEQYAVDLGQWPEVIATGGDAAMLFEGWDVIHAIAPNLTLYGVALAYVEQDFKQGT